MILELKSKNLRSKPSSVQKRNGVITFQYL